MNNNVILNFDTQDENIPNYNSPQEIIEISTSGFSKILTENVSAISPTSNNQFLHNLGVEFSFAPDGGIMEYNLSIKPRMTPIATGTGNQNAQGTIAEANGEYIAILNLKNGTIWNFYLTNSSTGSKWSEAVKIDSLAESTYYESVPRLIIDNSSTPNMWYLLFNNNEEDLCIANSSDRGITWNVTNFYNGSSSVDNIYDLDLCINSTKHIQVVWLERDGIYGDVMYASASSSDLTTWTTPIAIETNFIVNINEYRFGGVAIGNNNNTNVTYITFKNQTCIKITNNSNNWVNKQTIITNTFMGEGLSMCFDNSNTLFLSFFNNKSLYLLNNSISYENPSYWDYSTAYLDNAIETETTYCKGGRCDITLMRRGNYPRILYCTGRFGTDYDIFSIAGNGLVMNISGGAISMDEIVTIDWDGRDYSGNFVEDDDYSVWVTTYSGPIPTDSNALILSVDNVAPSITSLNPSISVFSPFNSTDIKDEHEFKFDTSEYVNYWISIKNLSDPSSGFASQTLNLITEDSPYDDLDADFVKDKNNRLWMVYYSKKNLKNGIWIQYSDDLGKTWSEAKVVIENDLINYINPAIAVYEDNIYVSYEEENSHVLFTRSDDEGDTWTTPQIQISDSCNSELAVSENGTVFMVLYEGLSNWSVKYNHNNGDFGYWETKTINHVSNNSYDKIDIAVNGSNAIYLAVENQTSYISHLVILTSTNWGDSWVIQKSYTPSEWRQYKPNIKLQYEYSEGELKEILYLLQVTRNSSEFLAKYNIEIMRSVDQGKNWDNLLNVSKDRINTAFNLALQPFWIANESFLLFTEEYTSSIKDIYLNRYGNTFKILSGIAVNEISESIIWDGKDFFGNNAPDEGYLAQ